MLELFLIHPSPDKNRFGSKRRMRSSMAQINLPLLAAYADSDFEVRIIDENIEEIDFDAQADLVGITTMTSTAFRAYQIGDQFRKRGVYVVMGGIHASLFPEEAGAHADTVVVGEAEVSWPLFLKDFKSGTPQRIYSTQSYHNLAGLPTPRRDLLRPGGYTMQNVVMTTRGCPHDCAFCSVTSFWGGKIRTRPVEEVIEEVRQIKGDFIQFVDDNIYGHRGHAEELFEAMIPLKKTFGAQGDITLARNPQLLRLAVRAGLRWLFIGVESPSAENLADVGKAWNRKGIEFEEAFDILHKAGVNLVGSFIFGLDNDDESSFDRTVDFAIKNKLELANFYILTPLPGTKLHQRYKSEGRLLTEQWDMYDCNRVVIRHPKLTGEQLLEGYIYAYKKFNSLRSIYKRIIRPRTGLGSLLPLNVGRYLRRNVFEQGCRMGTNRLVDGAGRR